MNFLGLFAQRLREKREQKKITQRELAERLNMCTRTVIEIEKCKSNPKFETVALISEEMDISLDGIVFHDSLHPGANRQYRGRGKGIHGISRFRCKTPAPAASAQMPCRCVCLRCVCFHASFVPPFGSRPIIYPENAKKAPVRWFYETNKPTL